MSPIAISITQGYSIGILPSLTEEKKAIKQLNAWQQSLTLPCIPLSDKEFLLGTGYLILSFQTEV